MHCEINRIIPAFLLWIIHIPIKEIIYAGEALAVQCKRAVALFLSRLPFVYKVQTFLTPVGNPVISPPTNAVIFAGASMPIDKCIRKSQSIKKGKSEGITEV